jgi:hypothetical protein
MDETAQSEMRLRPNSWAAVARGVVGGICVLALVIGTLWLLDVLHFGEARGTFGPDPGMSISGAPGS